MDPEDEKMPSYALSYPSKDAVTF